MTKKLTILAGALVFAAASVAQPASIAGEYTCVSMGSRPCATSTVLELSENGIWSWGKYAGRYRVASGRVLFDAAESSFGGAATWGPAIVGQETLTFTSGQQKVVWQKPSGAGAGPAPGTYFCRTAPGSCQTAKGIEIRSDGTWSWGGSGGSYTVIGGRLIFAGPQVSGWGPADIGAGTLTFQSQYGPSQWSLDGAAGAAPPPSSGTLPSVNPNIFDLSGVSELTPFDQQRVMAYIQPAKAPGASSFTKSEAHEKLSDFYRKSGDIKRAQEENQRALYWKNGGN